VRRDGQEVPNPMRAGSPETDQADPSAPRSPGVQAGRDVAPHEDERAGIVTTSDGPDGWGECSGGVKPRKASTAGLLRESGGSTDSPRERGPAGGRRPLPSGRRTPGNVRRAGAPRGVPIACEGKALKGEAHGRSGASCAGRVGGGSREGGSQTSDVARGGGGIRRQNQRVRRPGMCRRARKPRRGSIAGRSPDLRVGDATLRCGAAGTCL
jgi:hypothetical protein